MAVTTLRWSQLNGAQRAALLAGAQFNKSTIRNGRVIPGEPKNAEARVLVAARALDRDDAERRKREGRDAMAKALSAFAPGELQALATKFEAGRAYGHGELQRKHRQALPMRYYANSGYGS